LLPDRILIGRSIVSATPVERSLAPYVARGDWQGEFRIHLFAFQTVKGKNNKDTPSISRSVSRTGGSGSPTRFWC
jgi:hypothetical protein